MPVDGAVLDIPPADVLIRFDEDVTPIAAEVIDDRCRVVTPPDALRALGSILGVWLPADLPPGEYAVRYRVRFGDSHTASGSLTFRVRTTERDGVGEPQEARRRHC